MEVTNQRKTLKMFSYSMLAMSYGLMINFLNVNVFNFYTDEVLLDLKYIPIILTIYAIWNAVNDPLFGLFSDKIKTPLGRRFPFILFGFIPFTLFFTALWILPKPLLENLQTMNFFVSSSEISTIPFVIGKNHVLYNISYAKLIIPLRVNQISLFLYLLAFLLAFDTLFTMVVMSWQTLFPEKFKTDKERNYVAAITQTVRLVGIVFGILIPPLFIEYGNIDSYKLPILILVVIILIGFVLSLYGCRDEGIKMSNNDSNINKPLRSNWVVLKDMLKNRNLIVFTIALGLSNIAFLILMAMVRFMNKWVLVLDPKYETYFNGIAFGLGLLTFYIWARISIKRGPKFVFILSGTLFFVGLFPLAFAQEGWFWIAMLAMVFVGFALSGLLIVPDVLLAEIIDEETATSGEKREGIIYGIYGFAIRIAIVFESYLVTIVLQITGFDPLLPEQTPQAKAGIKFLMVGIPAICFFIANLLLILFYDLSRKKLEQKHKRKFSLLF